jgi:hypothetical protein
MDKKILHCLNFQTVDVVILVGLPLGQTTEWSDDFEALGIDPLVEDVRLEDGLDRHLPRILVRGGLFPSTSAVRKFIPGKFTTPLLRDLGAPEFSFLKVGRKRAILIVGNIPQDRKGQ